MSPRSDFYLPSPGRDRELRAVRAEAFWVGFISAAILAVLGFWAFVAIVEEAARHASP